MDIEKALIVGTGSIVIGQACEFDYSGVPIAKVATRIMLGEPLA